MFQRGRTDGNTSTKDIASKHLPRSSDIETEERLNKRLDNEIKLLLDSFGDIINSSRIENSELSTSLSNTPLTPLNRRKREADNNDDGNEDDEDEDDGTAATSAFATSLRSKSSDPTKDKYVVAREAYSAHTRAATMVRSVENLLSMVADIKQAHLVNDTATLSAMTDHRRKDLATHTQKTRSEIEELNSTLDAAVRDLEKVYYSSKYQN